MKGFNQKYGSWAIVAGAADGLGEAYSISLAERGMNLIMVDIQEEKMFALARQLETSNGIETICLHTDLRDKNSVDTIIDATQNLECRLLIFNAAYSRVKPFLMVSEDELNGFVQLNCNTQIKLVHGFAKKLVNGGLGGGIILMSSLSGLLGMQLVASYAATKAFSWNLAESLHNELSKYGIDVMACVAGATSTPAYLSTNPHYGWIRPSVMKPESVVQKTLNKLGRKTLYIPGFSNSLNYFVLTRLLPRKWAVRIANKAMANMHPEMYQQL